MSRIHRTPFRTGPALVASGIVAALLGGCGGGGSSDGAADAADPPLQNDSSRNVVVGEDVPSNEPPENAVDEAPRDAPEPFATVAAYRVTLENLWGVDDFPQGFPDDAHLSLVGGVLHDDSVSFWAPGEPASPGIEDMAEAGLLDVFLEEEGLPAISARAANALVEVNEYTGPMVAGVPGRLEFEIEADARWPLLTLVTMLGPSPDWFVGVNGWPLDGDDGWVAEASIELPLYDGGTKSDIQPVMGGPDIVPALPIGLVAYDAATGTYLPSDEPQHVARLILERIR